MNKISSIPLLSLFISSFLLSPSLCDKNTQDLINQVCRQTSDFGFCNQLLNRNLPSPVLNLAGLTKLTINLSLMFAKDTKTFITKAKDAEKDLKLKRLYLGCEIDYQTVVDFFGKAQDGVNRADYRSMVTFLNASSRPIIFCQDSIGDFVFQLREKNRRMRVLLTMGLYEGTQL